MKLIGALIRLAKPSLISLAQAAVGLLASCVSNASFKATHTLIGYRRVEIKSLTLSHAAVPHCLACASRNAYVKTWKRYSPGLIAGLPVCSMAKPIPSPVMAAT